MFNSKSITMKKILIFGLLNLLLIGQNVGKAQELWGWGRNFEGQLGEGTITNMTYPIHVDNNEWSKVSSGEWHTLAIRKDGTLWATGYNIQGQIGDGTNVTKSTFVQIGIESDWAQVFAGTYQSFAIKKDGSLWAWGDNTYGQLGDGTQLSKAKPVKIGSSNDWEMIAAGNVHTIALKKDGSLWSWGSNVFGQLGDGTILTSSEKYLPRQIGTSTDWVKISSSLSHSVALKKDGTIWAWGDNGKGQLGDGTRVTPSSPIQIGSSTEWVEISAGYWHSAAIKKDGSLWTWGYNDMGQLGNGKYSDDLTPNQISSTNDWRKVSLGGRFGVAIKKDGTLWAWGVDEYGAVGDSAKLLPSQLIKPIMISKETDWAFVDASKEFTMALKGTGYIEKPITLLEEKNQLIEHVHYDPLFKTITINDDVKNGYLSIIDLKGIVAKRIAIIDSKSFYIGNVHSGMYFIKIEAEKGIFTDRIIVK